jgi:retinol-binding protein 3
MLRKLFLLLLVCAGAGFAQTAIPDTLAGHALAAWLDAFNSGDRTKIEAYVQKFDPNNSVERIMSFRSQTGGFDLIAILNSEPTAIKFKVKEKGSATVAIGNIRMKDAQSITVESLGVRAIPPDAKEEEIKLDGAERERIVEAAAAKLNEYYVYAEIAKKMANALNKHLKNGDYNEITEGDVFAARLTTDLQDVSHDKHLRVAYSPYKLPPSHKGGPTPEEEARFRRDMDRLNCGFSKVEILPNNIGYVKFDMFAGPDICGPTATAAMNFMAHVNAIIFDLRENGGGDPLMVAFLATYLFDDVTHLSDIYERKEDKTTQYWTLPYVPGTRLAKIPAYVLTSKFTFSGAEDFAYNLQWLKRVTVVGETTGGGAHPVSGHRLDDHFSIGVPYARDINPMSKANWEGTGVTPDVSVKASEALETAEKLATAKIRGGKEKAR